MKKISFIAIVCLSLLGGFYLGTNNVRADSNEQLYPLQSIDNAKTLVKTCVKHEPRDYQPCSYYIPKNKSVFVYIYTVDNYYKIVYVQSFKNEKPKGIAGWVQSKDVKYICCK